MAKNKKTGSTKSKKAKKPRQLTIGECLSNRNGQDTIVEPPRTNQRPANELCQNSVAADFQTPSDLAGEPQSLQTIQQIQSDNQEVEATNHEMVSNGNVQPTKESIINEIRGQAFRARSSAKVFRRFVAKYPELVCSYEVTRELEDVLLAVTAILTWRGNNSTVLQLIWVTFEQIKKWTGKSIRVLWLKMEGDDIIPYILTVRASAKPPYSIVQARVETSETTSGTSTRFIQVRKGQPLEPKKAPLTHGFLIDFRNYYKIMEGQIDASPKVLDSKITFEVAKENLMMALLRLMKSTGVAEMPKQVEQLVVETSTSEDNQMQTRQMVARKARTLINKLNSEQDHQTEEVIQPNNTEVPPEPLETQEIPAPTVESGTVNNQDKDAVVEVPQCKQGKQVKLTFKNAVSEIRKQGPECVKEFDERIGKFQMEMQTEERQKSISVDSQKFTPPTGYVPVNLTSTQFKKVSKVFARRDGDMKAKQYRYLNLMNVIQTTFKETGKKKVLDAKDVIHRKICDGNMAAAFRIAKGEMKKERVEITQDDIEKLYPLNQNGQWEKMQYKKVQRSLADERIDSIIRRLPKNRAPGRSRITYGLIKRLNNNEKTAHQLHELVKQIYLHPDKVPEEFYTAEVRMIPKPNNGKRPIALQESIVKVIHKHIAATVTGFATANEEFSNSQFCIGCPEGTAEAAGKIFEWMNGSAPCYAVSLDLSNAFNSIDQQCIVTGLETLGVPDETIEYIYHYLRGYRIHYVSNGYEYIRKTHRGVPQGCPAAMALFAVGLFQALKGVIEKKEVQIVCYADDIVLLADTPEKAEKAVKEVEERLTLSQLTLNSQKTKRITNGTTEQGYTSWVDANWEHLGVPISPNIEFILSCLENVRKTQLDEMDAIWGDKLWSHHEAFLLQKMCIQPKAQYVLRSIIPDIPTEFMTEWDRKIEVNYPKYIRAIPEEYRQQSIPQGGLQLVPPSVIRVAASTAFKAHNDLDNLEDNVKEYIQATTKEMKGESLQQTINRFLNWYSLQKRMAFEKFREIPRKGRIPNLPQKLVSQEGDALVRGRPVVMTKQDSSWLARLPNRSCDVLDTLAFKIALTLRYNLEWEEDKELARIVCPNHKKASNSDSKQPSKLSLRHALGCRINAEGKIVSRHDSIVRIVGKKLAVSGCNPRVEQPLPYEVNGQRKVSAHRPDVWCMTEDKLQVYDVTVGSLTNTKDKESWNASRNSKMRQYKELNDAMGDKVQINIIQFDVAGRVGSETESILNKIGVTKSLLTNIQLMILSLNSWLYRNIIEKAVGEKNEGRGVEAQLWASRMLAEY